MKIDYRMATAGDHDALVSFWNEHAGWDQIEREIWEQRFIRTPYGPAEIAIAFDMENGELLGQFLFVPFRVAHKGQIRQGYRPFAPITQTKLRTQWEGGSLQQLIFQLYALGVQHLTDEGADVISMLPDPRWTRIFKMAPFFQIASFPLYSRALAGGDLPTLTDNSSLISLNLSDERIDALEKTQRFFYDSQIIRERSMLKWKLSLGHYYLFGIEKQGELTGFFAAVMKNDNRQWLVCDILAADTGPALKNCVVGAVLAAQQAKVDGTGPNLEKVALLATPTMQAALEPLAFYPDDYEFTLVVQPLDRQDKPEDWKPSGWYVSAND